MTYSCHPGEINVGSKAFAVAFAADGECLVIGHDDGVRVWGTKDGKQIATMKTEHVQCLAVSKDGRRIAAGTLPGFVYVWDTETYEQVFKHKEDFYPIHGVDFSPDSIRFVVGSNNYTATVWDVATSRRVLAPLRHEDWVTAAKYSPQGDRIATTTRDDVRVWNSLNGHLLVDIKLKVTPWFNNSLIWPSNDQLLVASDGKIKQIEATTGSVVLDWQVPDSDFFSCIAQPRHGKFVACAAGNTVTLWDGSTHAILAFIQHTQYIRSITLSPDDQFLAIGGQQGKIAVRNLSHFSMPFINIADAIFDYWKHDRFADTEASLTAIITSSIQSHHDLASRALVRAHLRHWDIAIEDAENSLRIRTSVIGYIAKSVALIGSGRKAEGCRVLDLAFRHCDPVDVDHLLLIKAVILFIAGERKDAVSRVDHLIAMVDSNSNSICYLVQAYMHLIIGNSHMNSGDYVGAVQSFKHARDQVRQYTGPALLSISLISGWKFDHLDITTRQRLCEALYAAGRTKEGVGSLLDMVNTFEEGIYMSASFTKWVSDFAQRCLVALASDTASQVFGHNVAQKAFDSSSSTLLLREWVKSTLANDSWKDALTAAATFVTPRLVTYRAVCEYLETIDCVADASECFRQMVDELSRQEHTHGEQIEWVIRRLEVLGDEAVSAERYDDAISKYSAALSLDPASPQSFFIKRSEAYVARGLWKDALDDANKAIALDPSSPWGYERKHAALHEGRKYESAIIAFEAMLSKMSDSPDPDIRGHRRLYINPEDTKGAIRRAIQDSIRGSPRILINTTSGRLCNKSEQAAAFESLPVFIKLISSMTTCIDRARIEKEVREYYRYATFSHKWEEDEPLFEKVVRIAVYDLERTPTHDKLQMFCKIVRDAGLHWAWSDTCCINRANHLDLQEALVAMFKWYEGSAVTIVFLRSVRSPSLRGDLVHSIWNTRSWTLQEYHASKVVRFYTEDWQLYRNLRIFNHKDSPEIISEVEEATGISARALMALRPGLDDIREKLSLASGRETTYIEDAAYSLLGIFSISLPIMYGEGNQALGRLLAQLLTSSGDTSVLAWTGRSGSFNSCLPADISVFSKLPTSHIPPVPKSTEMEMVTPRPRASSINIQLAMQLYDRLSDLPMPVFAGQRMKISCIVFKLGSLSTTRSAPKHVFRAQTAALGVVSIKTKEDLTQFSSLYLIHPWIDFLLDRQSVGSEAGTATIAEEGTDNQSFTTSLSLSRLARSNTILGPPPRRATQLLSRLGRPFGGRSATISGDASSLRPPSSVSQTDKETRALQLLSRLRQPFGALLLTQTRQNAAEYRRVASESTIIVQVQDDAPLNGLVDNTRMLDVL